VVIVTAAQNPYGARQSGAGSTAFTKGKPVNKSEFIDRLATQFEGNKKAASLALDAVIDTITREVARGEKVAITGFGAFEKALRPARMVRNPRTGERIRAKKTSVPKFRAGAELKAVVSGDKKPPKVAVGRATAPSAAATTRKTATKATGAKSAAKKTTARVSGAAKKTGAAAKSAAKKTGTKRTASASTARKAPARKATAKKTTAKKTTAKKAPARTSAAKKPTARKTAKKS